jgi:hypothetical protein
LRKIILIILIITDSLSAIAQGTFRNLGFEEALIAPGTPEGKISTSFAIPGWSAFLDETLLSEISYNRPVIFRSDITLFDRTSGLPAIDGQYKVSLWSEGIGDSSIRQTGIVPSAAPFLLFKLNPRAKDRDPSDLRIHPIIRMNGEVISYRPLEFASNYTLYSADVSRFAGQSVTLEFAAVRPPQAVSSFSLDSIEFSNVPEPRSSSLIIMAVGLILWRTFRKTA